MNVFDLDRALVSDYERFARSFTQIRAADIRVQIENLYASNRFGPDPLISINPHFERSASIDRLAADGTVHGDTARVFRIEGQYIRLYRHQEQAVAKTAERQSFVVTSIPPSQNSRSVTSSATSSERRKAPANPSNKREITP